MSHCQVVVVAAAFTTHPGKLDGQLGRVPRVLGGIVQESSGDITGIYYMGMLPPKWRNTWKIDVKTTWTMKWELGLFRAERGLILLGGCQGDLVPITLQVGESLKSIPYILNLEP